MVTTLEAIALRRQLTASRMKPLFLIVQRNAQFWLRSPFPGSRGYVQFRGSQMLFEYYVGEGLQLQPLANFKKANALHGACVKPTGVACNRTALAKLLDEMVATRVRRGKFTAWEYYFDFGGRPPWISGMATATGIQAFGRAGQLLNTTKWRKYVQEAYGAFTTPAPTGVLTRGPLGGHHYLQYSFAPRLYIINAMLQSVIGLYDYAEITGDPTAARLWRAAEPEARKELPANDTGDWSTYSYRGRESTREYYDLLLEFAAGMCHRTKIEQYCTTTKNFRNYISQAGHAGVRRPHDRDPGPGDPGPLQRGQAVGRPDRDHPRERQDLAEQDGDLQARRRLVHLEARARPARTRSRWRPRSCARARACARAPSRPRSSRSSPYHPPMAPPRTILYTGKGGVGKTSRRRRDRAPLRGRGPAHGGAVHRPGAQPVRLARGAAGQRADRDRPTTCSARS